MSRKMSRQLLEVGEERWLGIEAMAFVRRIQRARGSKTTLLRRAMNHGSEHRRTHQ